MYLKKLVMQDVQKKLGQVFTPRHIVETILDAVGYTGARVLQKYIFEPGCGTGNFLVVVIERYIAEAKKRRYTRKHIAQDLERYIYGVEIDAQVHHACIQRLNTLIAQHGIPAVCWNIFHADILDLDISSLPTFDFVVGNPPYVRIHHLEKNKLNAIKSRFTLCGSGIINLFLVFFEIGILTLNAQHGALGFITPNSFIHNSTYSHVRAYLAERMLLRTIINFEEHLLFEHASTYSAITILDAEHRSPLMEYCEYKNGVITPIATINMTEQHHKKWHFSNRDDAAFLRSVQQGAQTIADVAVVQYGFATLLDAAYIVKKDAPLAQVHTERAVLRPVVKASRYDGGKNTEHIIYPYAQQEDGIWRPIHEAVFQRAYPHTYRHLLDSKAALKKRSCDASVQIWYAYGRSQGIQTMHHEKLVINPIFKDRIKVFKVNKNTMVYSGIYLFMKEGSASTLDAVQRVLESPAFLRYAHLVGKNMRGGYKNINTKAIKEFMLL